MREKIRKWYEGEFVPYKNDPNSAVFFVNGGQFKRHWTAKLVRWAFAFWLREWKWTLGAAFTVVSVIFLKRL
jgi:hypothetical protein